MRGRMKRISDIEFGYLVGLYLGDGYINYNKKDRHYRIDFSLNSERDIDIIKRLLLILRKSSFNPFIVKDKRCSALSVRINSKLLFGTLIKEKQKFRRRKFVNNNYMLGLLSGLIDSEGYVGNGEIVITQKDKTLLDTVKYICNKLNIKWTKMWYYTFIDHKIWRLRISTSFKRIPNFSCKVARMLHSGVEA